MDPDTKLLEEWSPVKDMDLKRLTYLKRLTLKLVMLIALGSAFRVQIIALIKLDNIIILTGGMQIIITDLIKTSRVGADQPHAFFPYFDKETLCVSKTLLQYLEVTKNIRGNTKNLFISFKRPDGRVGSQSVSRWLKIFMDQAGLDEDFGANSTRHASTSRALVKGLDINNTKKAAGWSKDSMFFKFYNRPLRYGKKSFAEAVLS